MRAFSLAALLLGLATLAQIEHATPRADDTIDVRLTTGAIVWIPEGTLRAGASEGDLHFATLLCQEEHDLAVAEGCSADRFRHEHYDTPDGTRCTEIPAFGIDRTEVTNLAWRRCVTAGRCVPPRIDDDDPRFGGSELPVAGITHAEAAAYCAFAGGRLPTELEWERAARGGTPGPDCSAERATLRGRRRFPWGRAYHPRLANHGRPPLRPDPGDGFRFAAPVGSFPDGASPFGVLDLAGNAMEWTASEPTLRDFALQGATGADPATYRSGRGGSWAHPAVAMRVTHRGFVLAADSHPDLGVRCAYDP
jgi:sulfatase modifying factor 1